MSFRYGVVLIPDPSFVAHAHRARKLICDQYGSWEAEMFMVHLTVADYFQCSDRAVKALSGHLADIAAQSRIENPGLGLTHNGATTFFNQRGKKRPGTIILNFDEPASSTALHALHGRVIDSLETLAKSHRVVPDLTHARNRYVPHLTLLHNQDLKRGVFESALRFSESAVRALKVPFDAYAWELMLVRFSSRSAQAIEGGWEKRLWVNDLRSELLSSHPL